MREEVPLAPALPGWLRIAEQDLVLTLRITPRAAATRILGARGDALKVAVAAPPERGKANDALLAFLGEILAVAQADLEVTAGAGARDKRVRVRRLSARTALERITPWMPT